jgi:lysophospholipase L1-like esterase
MYVGNDIVASAKDKSPDQVLEFFKYVVKQLREKFPETPITWLQISPSEKRWAAWDQVQQANTLIKQYCSSQTKLYYIEFQDAFLGSDGLPKKELYLSDKLHYNESGYKVWGNRIKNQIKET